MTKYLAPLLCGLAFLAAPVATQAANFDFHVTLDVRSLIGNPNSPFYLDFQLNQGSGTFDNFALISNLSFDSGTPTGTPMTFGDASGSLSSSVRLHDSTASPFNELFQSFSAAVKYIDFDVNLTRNPATVTPDGFIISLLDNTTGQISTNSPDMLSLVTVDINSNLGLSDVRTYSSTSPAGVTAQAVPEPSPAVALGGGLAALLFFRARRSHAA